MADIKWIKITSYMFEDEKIRLIDAMPEGIMVIYVWIRLLVQAGKINAGGCVFLNENIPYTAEMLATLFGKPNDAIKSALKILCYFQMIEIDSNNIIKILNWEKHQNIEGMERVREQNRKRAENHRKKIKEGEQAPKENLEKSTDNNFEEENDPVENNKVQENQFYIVSNVTVTEQNKKENKKKKEIKRESNNSEEIKNSSQVSEKKLEVSTLPKSDNLKNREIAVDNPENFEEVNREKAESDNLQAGKIAPEIQNVNSKALEISMHYEKLTGIPSMFNSGSIALALDMHGEKYVKMAINKAIEVNKVDMNYINGILKNWRREGYPKEDVEVKKNEHGIIGKNGKADKNEFTGIKPKEPRKLTEEERRRVEEKLI